jgi:5-methylcytosine-specific restriction endonuclease McrA
VSARKRLYDYIKAQNKNKFSSEELRAIGKIDDWARTLRQLRQDKIIDYDYQGQEYRVTNIGKYSRSSKRASLTSKDKYRIRHRDGHRCQSCGNGVNDGVKLHVDHKVPIEWGGDNSDDNLWTLCSKCNLAKKAFFKDDFDSEVMKLVSAEKSGYLKLKVLFENSPNKKFTPSILQGIAGIRDWPRTLRLIRKNLGIKIIWHKKSQDNPNGAYEYIKE